MINQYSKISSTSKQSKAKIPQQQIQNDTDELIYDDKWMGKYSQKDIDYLNNYYAGLERDYKIITENHRDYARKIAKA